MHKRFFGVAAPVAVFVLGACSDAAAPNPVLPTTGGSAGTTGAAATTGTTSSTTSSATAGSSTTNTGAGGSSGTDTTSAATTSAGTGGSTTSGGGSAGSGGSTGGSAGSAGSAGAAGQSPDAGGGGGAITKVVPTAGCGMPPGPTGSQNIPTMGTKPTGCADSKCGDWMYSRNYIVTLPAGYNNMKAYPLVFEGPGCGSNATAVYPLNDGMGGPGNVGNTVIRVGLTPPPLAIGHATNPLDNCFDDKEGDDSVDWVFYENLYDRLAGQFCFDRNRVFSAGNSSGSWFSNELGCKYAGDATRPVRGVLPNTGGLPDQPQYKPTCTTKPMAGFWVHETGDPTNPFTGNKYAIARAMQVNGCTIGTNYDNTMFDNFPIGGGNPDATCKKIRGCPDLYPLVVCPLVGNGHGSHDNVVNPGYSTFLKMFSAGAFLTP